MFNTRGGVSKTLMSFKMVFKIYKKFCRHTKQVSDHFKLK